MTQRQNNTSPAAEPVPPVQPGRRNRWGRRGFGGPGGGARPLLPATRSFRGTSVQMCGWWPWAAASTRPGIGVPVGVDIETGSTVCCDVFSWFRAGLISSPSMTVLGTPGMGKSSFAARQILGAVDAGITPLIAADLKPDYTHLVQALGGQVIAFGNGQQINPLDPGTMAAAAARIGGPAGAVLAEQAGARAAALVGALVQVTRRAPVADWEATLLTRAVRELSTRHNIRNLPAPTLADLAGLLTDPTDALAAAVHAETHAEYRVLAKGLNRSLAAVLDGPLGTVFAGPSTTRLDTTAPAVCVDISQIARGGEDLLAAVMLACWSETFATVEAANALADAGNQPQRHFLTVMDEMWRPLRLAGAGLVDKLDAITRLNRAEGVGHIFITHTLKDLESMDSAAEVAKARGFIERSGIVVSAALSREDLRSLSNVRRLSQVEIDTVAAWATPPAWPTHLEAAQRPADPPGVGKVLIKVGQRPGIATQVVLTATERGLHDSNHRWTTPTPPPELPAPRGPAPAEPARTRTARAARAGGAVRKGARVGQA